MNVGLSVQCGRSMAERVLFDVNVLLDVIENRQPFVTYSGPALEQAMTGQIHGFIAASSVDTLAFLLRKMATSAQLHRILEDLVQILEIAPVDGSVIRAALAARWRDPEDAILYYAAESCGCTVILTRNPADFRRSAPQMRIATPEEFIR